LLPTGILLAALAMLALVLRSRVAPGGAAAPVGRPPVVQPEHKVFPLYAGSESCRECHQAEWEQWRTSNHGLAERPVSPELDKLAFDPPRTFRHGTQSTEVVFASGRFEIRTLGFGGTISNYPVDRVIGNSPLRQFLTPIGDGRWQTHEASYDPITNKWFNSYGNEDRVPGEWGHWTGRGMNWNAMCAFCHNTRLRKNYDPATDTYHTTMAEQTVGCEACHGPMKDHGDWRRKFPDKTKYPKDPTIVKFSVTQVRGTCGACHSRRHDLTGDFHPGESYFDHYSLTMVDESDTYYPDGQVRDEDYAFASFLSSYMRQANIRCIDCHQPHTAKRLLPGNDLCMRCHNGGLTNAPVIDPAKHSFHSSTNSGFLCTGCHMPQTTYMQVHHRHDHGFTIPDPLLTKQFGIPNACNRCHADKSTEWSIEFCEKWYGAKMDRHYRARSQWLAKAKAGDDSVRTNITWMIRNETNFFWQAAAANFTGRWLDDADVRSALLDALKSEHPLVREKAVRALEPLAAARRPAVIAAFEPLLNDPVRSVRHAAAWALRSTVDLQSRAGEDLLHALAFNADQPLGQLQLGILCSARNEWPRAVEHFRAAVDWDSNSAPLRHEYAVALSMVNQPQEALRQMQAAVRLAPSEAEFRYKLGLAYAEAGDAVTALTELRAAVKLDPRHTRALYNLGLALNAAGQAEAAIEALLKAEAADPRDSRAPYARATILARLNRPAEARAAAERALQIQPDHTDAEALLRSLR
jgi:tetratricopeptide (TPR) repeat protein